MMSHGEPQEELSEDREGESVDESGTGAPERHAEDKAAPRPPRPARDYPPRPKR